jgi:TRAP-type mannitol/chloroaromatic compound transport system permease large subunit
MTLLIAFSAFFLFLFLNMPIAFGIALSALAAGLTITAVDNTTLVQRMMAAINSFPLLAVIFFIFAGVLMARGGVSTRLVKLAEVIVGRIPGGWPTSTSWPRCSSAASRGRRWRTSLRSGP